MRFGRVLVAKPRVHIYLDGVAYTAEELSRHLGLRVRGGRQIEIKGEGSDL